MDKRNQILECPHCDRTFQQTQRYREHIAKKHAEEVQESSDAGDASIGPAQVSIEMYILHGLDMRMQYQAKQTVQRLENEVEVADVQGTKTMQPGSKGGYYTDKSPMLLLMEWCQQQKRVKPRYKDLPIAAGLHKCRVCRTAMTNIWLYCACACSQLLHNTGQQ